MINKKAFLAAGTALVAMLMLSSLMIMHTARSQDEGQVTLVLLQMDGIPGESTVINHERWINIDVFGWGEAMASVTGVIGGRGAARLNMTAFQFAMTTNNASTMLFLACATGRIIPHATLDVCKPSDAGPVMLLRFDFVGVIINSYSIAGNALLYNQNDQFSIGFTKITMTYWQYDEGGSLISVYGAYYDLISGKGGIV